MEKDKFKLFLDKIAIGFEFVIAFLLLIVIAVKLLEISLTVSGVDFIIIDMDFNAILSLTFSLVIGIEFVRMLFKHTSEAVIDVLLLVMARHLILYYESTTSLILGVVSIAILFATKKYLINIAGETINGLMGSFRKKDDTKEE